MSAFDRRFARSIAGSNAPYVDITGTTNATLNTQTLFAHTLRDGVGNRIIPSRVDLTANSATAPAGILYEVAANHTNALVDIRATGAAVPFRARLWV